MPIAKSQLQTRVEALVSTRRATFSRAGIQLGKLLGCGYQGCVYRARSTRDGKVVVKITYDVGEAHFAAYLLTTLEPLPKVLPRIYGVYKIPGVDAFALVREDLSDMDIDHLPCIPMSFPDMTGMDMARLPFATSYVLDQSNPIPRRKLLASLKKARGSYPHYVGCIDDSIELIEWALKKRIVMTDLSVRNWGIRREGNRRVAVIRDLGIPFGVKAGLISSLRGGR